jgi:NAD(P)-dependent dehydrogenase (short-subunit alcohol dehydrogenase family)
MPSDRLRQPAQHSPTDRALAAEGARLVLADRATCDDTQSAIRTAGGECAAVPTDVTSEGDVLRLLSEVETWLGGLDILVNNAGILIMYKRLCSDYGTKFEALSAFCVFGSAAISQRGNCEVTIRLKTGSFEPGRA